MQNRAEAGFSVPQLWHLTTAIGSPYIDTGLPSKVGPMAGEQLRVTEGDERGKVVEVAADVLLGRGATDTVARFGDDPLVSRRHAKVSRGASGQLAVEDLGSANGTFVNDERIEGARTLALGDLVRVGHTVFQVTDASGGVPQATRLGGEFPEPEPEPSEELLVTEGPAQGQRLLLGD